MSRTENLRFVVNKKLRRNVHVVGTKVGDRRSGRGGGTGYEDGCGPTRKMLNSAGTQTTAAEKKRRKVPLSRNANKKQPSPDDRYNEYVCMGAAYLSTVAKILSLATGETTQQMRDLLDPDRASARSFTSLLARLEGREAGDSHPPPPPPLPTVSMEDDEERRQQGFDDSPVFC